ncbi:uncharacterized protein [Dermacentor albipictus]|uniref:uncharacterized protein n=1 Tax=Dermacentor albipictus TaxID=60249 RepID=UPI0031FC1E8B
MDVALRQINLSLLYTLACDTTVSSEVQVKRFQCLLNNIDPADKAVVLGCQYNVGGTMDAATFLTALCENKLPCTKLRACMASERSKNMRPQKPPTLPEAENPIQAGVSGPEQGGMAVNQESTTSTAAPSTSASTPAPPEEVPTTSVATVPPSTPAAPPPGEDDPPPEGDDEGSREDEPSLPAVTAGTSTTSTEPPPAPVDVQPPPDDPLPAPAEEVTGGDEMSFYPCLCARKAKYRGLLWKPRMNSRRTRAITWKDYNFIFPLSVVRECLVANY